MSFYGDFEGALWAIATGTSGKEDCDNAQIMRGIAQEALGTAWTDYLNHQKGAKEAFGKVIPFDAPESPQDTDSTETVELGPESNVDDMVQVVEPGMTEWIDRKEAEARFPSVQPMADLSGYSDYRDPDSAYYKPNGSLPETD